MASAWPVRYAGSDSSSFHTGACVPVRREVATISEPWRTTTYGLAAAPAGAPDTRRTMSSPRYTRTTRRPGRRSTVGDPTGSRGAALASTAVAASGTPSRACASPFSRAASTALAAAAAIAASENASAVPPNRSPGPSTVTVTRSLAATRAGLARSGTATHWSDTWNGVSACVCTLSRLKAYTPSTSSAASMLADRTRMRMVARLYASGVSSTLSNVNAAFHRHDVDS